MAKKTPKPVPAHRPPVSRDPVGWGFWLICFVVLFGPSWFLAYRSTVEYERGGMTPWVAAFALAALGAGLFSVVVNYILRARATSAKRKHEHRKRR